MILLLLTITGWRLTEGMVPVIEVTIAQPVVSLAASRMRPLLVIVIGCAVVLLLKRRIVASLTLPRPLSVPPLVSVAPAVPELVSMVTARPVVFCTVVPAAVVMAMAP